MILPDQPEPDYHAHESISRSGLWTLYNRTPAHFKNSPPKKSKAMDFGSAVHIAALQPHLLEESIIKGGEDKRGNKWKDVVEQAAAYGGIPLTSPDYDAVKLIRDSVHKIPEMRAIIQGTPQIEYSAYHVDEETGVECRVRPDIYNPQLGIMADLKTTIDASEAGFSKSTSNFGYFFQDAMYADVWSKAGGGSVSGFFFIAIEKEYPYLSMLHEHPDSAVNEGLAVMRAVLKKYKECLDTNSWPGYPSGIQETDIKPWAYRETYRQNRY